MFITRYALSWFGLVMLAGTVQAQTRPGFGDLIGARGAGGETALQPREYAFVRGEKATIAATLIGGIARSASASPWRP